MSSRSANHFLIVGLGNPGVSYDETRHNIGMEALRYFAKKRNLKFRKASSFQGELAQGSSVEAFGDHKVFLLLPLTYMNSSGEAVVLCKEYFKIPLENILIVCDDIALPFGRLRWRAKGSSGGHNGLKSIESHLGTREYMRVKIGVGEAAQGDLSEHVLGKFTKEEKKALPRIFETIDEAIDLFLLEGIDRAMNKYNVSEKVEE